MHILAWPRQTLVQSFKSGGLNAQDFEAQLTSLHAKWIFKLLNSRHVASWKLLPFHFLRNLLPALDDSIFLVDPSILRFCTTFRWASYLQVWFDIGPMVAAPSSDFECILNKPIWFNRFLYFHSDNKRGFF
jgi:hypothetical protein